MEREFITTTVFDKRWRELGLSDDDLRCLENHIMKNPNAGNVIVGTGGAVKLRWALPGKGRSGGIRIIFIDLVMAEHVYFLTCYPKSKKDTLSTAEKTAIKEVVKRIVKNERMGS